MDSKREPPDPEAMRRPADVKEKPAELLARIGQRYGPEFVALCRMLATFNERDWARALNVIRDAGRERLERVEADIIRHAFHARPDKAEQLGQFRVLYARLIDTTGAAGGIVSNFAGDGPAERVNLFVDLFTAVCAMIGNPGIAPAVPQAMSRSGVAGIWPASQPGRPVDIAAGAGVASPAPNATADVPPLKGENFNAKFHNRETLIGPVALYAPHGYRVECSRCSTAHDLSGQPLPIIGFRCADCGAWVDCGRRPVDGPASPFSGIPPGTPLT